MKIQLIVLIAVLSVKGVYGQDEPDIPYIPPKNAIHFELLGNSDGYFSITYERIFYPVKDSLLRLTIRAGGGISDKPHDSSVLYTIPVEANLLIGKKQSFLEVGFGWTPSFGTSNLKNPNLPMEDRQNYTYSYFFRLGYRLMKRNGFVLRLAPLAEFVHKENSLKFQWAAGVSVGLAFRSLRNMWHELDD